MNLAGARAELAGTLEAGVDPTVNVYDHLPDQLAVPALLVGWADPWFEPADIAAHYEARAEVVAVAGRLDIADQADRLDELVAGVALVLELSAEWDRPVALVSPFALQVAGVNYLAASVQTAALVTLT